MRKYFLIHEEAVSHTYMTLHPIPLNFLIYEKKFLFFFISVATVLKMLSTVQSYFLALVKPKIMQKI
jgi:hypothetical protein